MALLDRWRRPQHPTTPNPTPEPPVPSLRVLRADGQRVDLTAKNAGTRLALVRQEWQTDAWTYRDLIGELRYAQRLLARSVAKVKFFAAELPDDPTADPIPLTGNDHHLDPALARDAVANLARLPLDDGPDGFVATFTENLLVAGEAWIHGQTVDGEEQWSVRSVSEITGAGDQVMLAELPGTTSLGQRVIDPVEEELLRCWTRHPRWGQLADSPLRAMLDVLEEVVLTGREMRAASRSRIAANGVLIVPNSVTLLRTRQDDEDLVEQGVLDNDFMQDFTEALTSPIRNEGDAGAVVPLILRGDAEALKEIRHLTLTRDDAVKLMERLQGAVLRMLQGLDIQPEQVQGTGTMNHWGGWLVEASNIRHQVLPTCGIGAGCFTKAFLRPALHALQHPPDQVRKVIVWYDPTGLVESPDRSLDAREAWDRDTISNEALREAHGFSAAAAPDAHEHLVRLLTRGRLTPQAVPLVAALSGVSLDDPVLKQALAISVGLSTRAQVQQAPALPPSNVVQSPQPTDVVPEQATPTPPASDSPPAGVTASAVVNGPVPGWRVEVELARALTDVDTSLGERVMVAADAAIARAVERADGRIRNAVRKDKALTVSIEGRTAALVLGRDVVGSFVPWTDLLHGAYSKLRDQVGGWLDQAGRVVADTTVKLLGLPPGSEAAQETRDRVSTRLAVHRPAALTALDEALDAATHRALFTDPQTLDTTRGERTESLVEPAAIAHVLVIAGGGKPGQPEDVGFGTGPVIRDVLTEAGGVVLGWEWQYRPQVPRRSHYPPHQSLDGVRFSTWTDPKLDTDQGSQWLGAYFHPNDHDGCLCSSVPVLAFPEPDTHDVVGRRLREAAVSQRGRLTTRTAAEDTAAGRVGTSLQNEAETRDRVLAGVEQLRAHYIEGVNTR